MALIVVGLLMAMPPLLRLWTRLSPGGGPIGPDSDEAYLASLALERGALVDYLPHRSPSYPLLVSAWADGPTAIAHAGIVVSELAAGVAGVGAYLLGRQLGGRVAGFAGMLLVLRLPVVGELGRQMTPYMLLAALDLLAVAGLVAMARGRLAGAVLTIGAAPILFAGDPKQVPFVIGGLALAVMCALRSAYRRAGVARILALGTVLGALGVVPLANALVARSGIPQISVEETITRVPLGFDVSALEPGWGLGAPLSGLPTTLGALARLRPPATQGYLHGMVGPGMHMQLPETSLWWSVVVLALVASLALRRQALAFGAVGLFAVLAHPVLHLYFQHRYAAPFVLALPVLAMAGLARVAGPWGVAGAALVALNVGPWRTVGPGLLMPPPTDGERWSGIDPGAWERAVASASTLPVGARVLDFAESRPWVMLAGTLDYVRCSTRRDACARELSDASRPIVAILFPREERSARVPEAWALRGVPATPPRLGSCWERVLVRPQHGAAFLWTCASPPRPTAPPPG